MEFNKFVEQNMVNLWKNEAILTSKVAENASKIEKNGVCLLIFVGVLGWKIHKMNKKIRDLEGKIKKNEDKNPDIL